MKGLFIGVLLLQTIYLSNGLTCHLCVGSLTGDCARGELSGMAEMTCEDYNEVAMFGHLNLTQTRDQSKDDIVASCVAFSGTGGGVTAFQRGCGYIYENMDICEFLADTAVIDLLSCKSCNLDYCNGD